MLLRSCFSEFDFAPNGNCDKRAWTHADWTGFNGDAFNNCEYPGIDTKASSLWTYKYLYLAFQCSYLTLNIFARDEGCAEGSELWTRDVVEAFIAPVSGRALRYYEVEVSPDNRSLELKISHVNDQLHRKAWNSGFDHAATIDSAGKVWAVEMRIPFQAFGAAVIPGADWRINLLRADGAESGAERRLLSWAPLDASIKSFHQPDSFGILRFEAP